MTVATPNMVWSTAVLLVLFMGTLLYFVVAGARKTQNMADYALGSVAFSPVAVGLALAASMTSAATFIINPGLIAYFGMAGVIAYAVVLPLSAMVSLIVLTKRFRTQGNTTKALTMAQWMGTRFNSKVLERFFAFLSLLLITFIILIAVGLTQVLSKSLNADPLYVLVGLVIFVFGYMMFGGANSMVYTNTIQAVLMLVVAVILLGSGYEHFSQGVHGFLEKLKAIKPSLVSTTVPDSPLFRDYFEIIFCQAVIGVAIILQPHIITKSLLLKRNSQVNKYLITGVVVELLFFSVVVVGLYARLQFPDLTVNGEMLPPDAVVSTYVVQEFPVYLGLVVVLGLLAAGMSTLEGLIQSLSTTITADLILPLSGRKPATTLAELKKQVALNRWVIVALAGITIAMSYRQILEPDLSVAILAQNGVYAYFAAAFVPVGIGLFFKNFKAQAAIAGSLTAVLVHFSIYYFRLGAYMQTEVRNPAVPATIAILASVAVALILQSLLKNRAHANG